MNMGPKYAPGPCAVSGGSHLQTLGPGSWGRREELAQCPWPGPLMNRAQDSLIIRNKKSFMCLVIMNSSGKRCSRTVYLCNDGCKKWCASAQNCYWINKGEKVWCEPCCKIGGYDKDFPSHDELVRNVSCLAHMAVVQPGDTDEFVVVGNVVGGGTPPPEPASRNDRRPQCSGPPGLLDAIPDTIRQQLEDCRQRGLASEKSIMELQLDRREMRDRVRHSEEMITELNERLTETEAQLGKWCARVQDLEIELSNEKNERRQLWVAFNQIRQATENAAWHEDAAWQRNY